MVAASNELPAPILEQPPMMARHGIPNRRMQASEWDEQLAFHALNALLPIVDNYRQSHRLSLEREWFWSIAHYLGIQGRDVREVISDDFLVEMLREGPHIVLNHMFRYGLSAQSRLAAMPPGWEVVPMTPDHSDQHAARSGQRVLDWVYRYDQFSFQEIRLEMGMWDWNTGTTFLLTDWNEQAGRSFEMFRNPQTGEPIPSSHLGPDARATMRELGFAEVQNEGDFEFEALGPFQVMLPDELKWDHIHWIAYELLRPIDWIWNRFGQSYAQAITEGEFVESSKHNYRNSLLRLSLNMSALSGESRLGSTGVVPIRFLHLRPSEQFPEGVDIIGTTQRILHIGPNKYYSRDLDMWHPLSMARYAYVPGRPIWGQGVAAQIMGAQNDLNEIATDEIDYRRAYSKPRILAPRNARMRKALDDSTGTLFEFDGSHGAPVMWNPPVASQAHAIGRQNRLDDMMGIAHQSEASQGQAPEYVRSGAALRSLQERDLAAAGPAIKSLEKCFSSAGSKILQLASKFLTVPRTIEIFGKWEMYDAVWFVGSDLRGNHRVHVRPGSMTPTSRAETIQLYESLVDRQILNPALDRKDKALVLKALEIGGAHELFHSEMQDRRRAELENRWFAEPRQDIDPPEVLESDDHQVHYEVISTWMKTDQAREIRKADPQRWQAIEEHAWMHQYLFSLQVQAMQALAAQQAPGPAQAAPKGQASKPAPKGNQGAPAQAGA